VNITTKNSFSKVSKQDFNSSWLV